MSTSCTLGLRFSSLLSIKFKTRAHAYSSLVWNIVEYLTLFLIVLLHEFGHSLACRQVGGTADKIMLWPLGGVAYIAPPQRPGAVLWSIAAGPLVNVVLLFMLTPVLMAYRCGRGDQSVTMSGLERFPAQRLENQFFAAALQPPSGLSVGWRANPAGAFVVSSRAGLRKPFVVDDHRICRRGRVGGSSPFTQQSIWMGFICYFVFLQCSRGLAQARALRAIEKLPRRDGFACPACGAAPPIGALWHCNHCSAVFDTFETQAVCPNCHNQFPVTGCTDCGAALPIATWRVVPPPPGEIQQPNLSGGASAAYSTVTLFAKLRGLSTSQPRATAV